MRFDERGQVTAFVVVFVMALLLFAGLVLDGGLVLAAKRRAVNEAEAAARAGAQALDLAAYRATGAVVLDPGQARRSARQYLEATGHEGEVSVGSDEVAVTVRFSQPMQILGIGGLGSVGVVGTGRARAAHGVDREDP
jgi:Flp pilus assembly protein TadG